MPSTDAPDHLRPRGATTTIARFLGEAADSAPIREAKTGRVQGQVSLLSGVGEAISLTIDDGTGELSLRSKTRGVTATPLLGARIEADVELSPDGELSATALRRSPEWT